MQISGKLLTESNLQLEVHLESKDILKFLCVFV